MRSTVDKESKHSEGNPHDGVASSAPTLPADGWTFCPTSFPPVDFLTVIAHVAKTGKTCKTVPQLSEDDHGIFIAMRSLDRAREFFYRGYVEEVMVCRKENVVFVKSKCWASQKKSVQYRQVLQLYCPEDGGCRV